MDKNEIDKIMQNMDSHKTLDVHLKSEMEKSFIAYAMAVNVSRAIPDVRDGLKPVHRRILYSMGEMNLFSGSPYKKCARIVGDTMGKYHPHGDSAIYDALVRLAQDFSINCPLVDGHGNFGSVDGDSPAAMRYTEARLSKIASEMLADIDKEVVDMYPNFDDTEMQPVVLPSRFPNLLVNGSDGIAVGMATNIPPHNLAEVIDATVALIDNSDIDIDTLMHYLPAPDFPTRGLIMGRSGIREMYETGKGSFVIRARAEIEEVGGKERIVVTEIPYQVNKAKLIIQIADMVKSKRIEGISDIREESDREGMRIVIEVKREANAQVVLNMLYKHTQMQVNFGAIMLALIDGVPKILNLKQILESYVKYQKEIITRRTRFDLDKAEQREHILNGLVIAQAHIDEVIKVIKHSEDKNDALAKLMQMFELSDKQAQAILDMRLQRLTGLEVEKLKQDLVSVQASIKEYKEILADENKVLAIIKNDLITIKDKYGVKRKSEITVDMSDINIEDLIAKEQVVISMTHSGYIKRLALDEYKAQHRGGKGVIAHKTKEEDFVETVFVSSSHDDLMCFSSSGRVYKMKAYEIPESVKNSKGRAMVNLLEVDPSERITAIVHMDKDIEMTGYLVMATRNGMIKRTPLSEFESIRKNGKIAIKLQEGDVLINAYITTGNDEIIMASSEGKCIRFNESQLRVTGRESQGVKSIKLNKNECIVDMAVVLKDHEILTISQNGYGKRTSENDYRTQGRGGKGVKAGIFNEETGKLVGLKQVTENDDIILISDDGQIIRIWAKEINVISRNTKGVRVMKVKGKSKIVAVAVTEHEEESQEDAQETEIDE